MKPTELDRAILYVLLIVGVVTVYRWVFKALDRLSDRAFSVVEYKYLTPDRKVIQPDDFTEKKGEDASGG